AQASLHSFRATRSSTRSVRARLAQGQPQAHPPVKWCYLVALLIVCSTSAHAGADSIEPKRVTNYEIGFGSGTSALGNVMLLDDVAGQNGDALRLYDTSTWKE